MAFADAIYQRLDEIVSAGGPLFLSQSVTLAAGAVFLLLMLGVIFEIVRLASSARRDRIEAERCRAAVEEQAVELRALSAAVELSVARAAASRLDEKPAPVSKTDCAVCARERDARRLAGTASAAVPDALLRKKA
jgi:hypothetical protein